MLGTITILSGQQMPRSEYLTYRASLGNTTEDMIKLLLRRCETGESDFPPDFPESMYPLAEAICLDVKASGGEVDPVIEEQVHQHVHPAPETAPESHEALEVLPPTPNTEIGIVEAARGARLDNAYTLLREKFTFSEDMSQVSAREDVFISPQDYGTLLGFSIDLGKRSLWLAGTAILCLQRMGHEKAVEVIADEAGFSYSHASNLARVCDRVPPEKRVGLLPTVAQEIATRQYSTDPEKNREIILELCDQAREGKMNCAQARSHAMLAQGKDVPIVDYSGGKRQLRERVKSLEGILHRILANYAGGSPAMEAAIADAREAVKD